jgi:5-methylcytosine-specific restriction endonuclease McrA
VLDLNRTDAVDRHDPPPWMRELVILRDRHCVFPRCARDARTCDLDHIVAYRPPDEGGPPGQTNPLNLAPLCQRHHRAKTFTAWTYQRQRDGTYAWTSPHGHTWTVDPDDTTATTTASLRALADGAAYTLAT